jgi:hypothetical protein
MTDPKAKLSKMLRLAANAMRSAVDTVLVYALALQAWAAGPARILCSTTLLRILGQHGCVPYSAYFVPVPFSRQCTSKQKLLQPGVILREAEAEYVRLLRSQI